MSDDKDASAFFSDGIHEDILTNLTTIRDLRVVSRTSVLGYRGTTKKIADVAKELGVAYVLEGSVRRAGNKVRVTGQLIRAATDEHIWAKNYDRDLTDIFAIQTELSQAIAGELKIALTPQEQRLLSRRPTENVAAYDLFLKAREARAAGARTAAFWRQQDEWLGRAVELDPKFAQAWAAASWTHGYRYIFNTDHTEARVALARAAIDTAMRLAPDDPYVLLERSYYYYFCYRDYARASEILENLVKLQPNDAATHYALANIRRRQGRWSEAMQSQRRTVALDPLNSDYTRLLIQTATKVRLFDEAAREVRRLSTFDASIQPWREPYLQFLATGTTQEIEALYAKAPVSGNGATTMISARIWWATTRGETDEVLRLEKQLPVGGALMAGGAATGLGDAVLAAVAMAAQGDRKGAKAKLADLAVAYENRSKTEPDNAPVWSILAQIHALGGAKEEAIRCAQRACELVPESADAWVGPDYRNVLAFVYAWTGEKDKALEEYRRLLRNPPSSSREAINVHEMQRSILYIPLRGDPRWEAMLKDPKNNEPLF